jgi:hypothetical protein
VKDTSFYTSPYNNLSSANANQGILTHGVLVNDFEPPKLVIDSVGNGYYYMDRLDLRRVNPRFDTMI